MHRFNRDRDATLATFGHSNRCVAIGCSRSVRKAIDGDGCTIRRAVARRLRQPRLLTVVFQGRFEPLYQRVEGALGSGELGRIQRCEIVETVLAQFCLLSFRWLACDMAGRGWWCGAQSGGACSRSLSLVVWCSYERRRDFATLRFMRSRWRTRQPLSCDMKRSARLDTCQYHGMSSLSRTMIACDRGRITIQDGAMKVDRLRDSFGSNGSAQRVLR